jgi:ubiquinone/menaquinone biosynthesis C-methylase UbiE
MEEGKKPGVRVMRKSPEELTDGAKRTVDSISTAEETYFTELSDGREVVLREMTAADLLYMEKSLSKVGDMERSLRLVSRLSTNNGRITFDELSKLKMKDLKKVTELLAKAGGTDEEEVEEDPNF